MSAAPYLSLILPAYNEARSIGPTLDTIRDYLDRQSYPSEVLVCADGTDGTRELVRDRGDRRLIVLGEPERRGKGRGIREGVERARGQVVGFMDADNKTPIDELDRVLPWLDSHDVVIGSRAVGDARIEVRPPLHRRLGSKGFALVMRALTGLYHIRDTQCGFKFFRGEVARDLFSRQRIDGYMFDVEVLYLAVRLGYDVKEIGVRWRDDGDTRLRLVSGNWRNMLDLLRIRFGTSIGTANPARRVSPGKARKAA
jgi:glycosyltransferase involved in cell wall biosynthesis